MKLLDFNGIYTSVDVRPSRWPLKQESVCKSKIQYSVGQWLQVLYIGSSILEEFIIPGSSLSLDFFIPNQKVAIEVQGRQHEEYVGFFHGPKSNGEFQKQKYRDSQKQRWCDTNNISLICVGEGITYDEFRDTIEQLKQQRRGLA